MGNTKLLKRILAGVLAAMIGLSALGGLVMAFAVEDDPSLPDPVQGGTEYIDEDDDWTQLLFDDQSGAVTLTLGETATLLLPAGSARSLWPGFDDQYGATLQELADRQAANFDVLNFLFKGQLEKTATLTFVTDKPYLYRIENGKPIALATSFADGAHTVQIDALACFVASDAQLTA